MKTGDKLEEVQIMEDLKRELKDKVENRVDRNFSIGLDTIIIACYNTIRKLRRE